MSIEQTRLVWKYNFTRPQQTVVLAYAEHADRRGRNMFPSVERIAFKTGYSARQVRRILAGLRAQGFMKIERPAQRHRPATYFFDWKCVQPKPDYLAQRARCASSAPGSWQPPLPGFEERAGKIYYATSLPRIVAEPDAQTAEEQAAEIRAQLARDEVKGGHFAPGDLTPKSAELSEENCHKEDSLRSPSVQPVAENFASTEEEKPAPPKTSKKSRKKVSADPMKEWLPGEREYVAGAMARLVERLRGLTDKQRQINARAARYLFRDGWTLDQAFDCFDALLRNPHRLESWIEDLNSVRRNIGSFYAKRRAQAAAGYAAPGALIAGTPPADVAAEFTAFNFSSQTGATFRPVSSNDSGARDYQDIFNRITGSEEKS